MLLTGVQKLFRPLERGDSGFRRGVYRRSRITGLELAVTVLADNHSAKVVDPYLQSATAGRAFLIEVRPCHHGISFYRLTSYGLSLFSPRTCTSKLLAERYATMSTLTNIVEDRRPAYKKQNVSAA